MLPLATTAGMIFVTVAPTTAGFDSFDQATTAPVVGQFTTPPVAQVATTEPFVVEEQTTQPVFIETTVRPTESSRFGTTQGAFSDTTPPNLPSMSPMGEYNDENFLRFQSIYENWRGNVFNSWLNTMSLYKEPSFPSPLRAWHWLNRDNICVLRDYVSPWHCQLGKTRLIATIEQVLGSGDTVILYATAKHT